MARIIENETLEAVVSGIHEAMRKYHCACPHEDDMSLNLEIRACVNRAYMQGMRDAGYDPLLDGILAILEKNDGACLDDEDSRKLLAVDLRDFFLKFAEENG